MNRSLAFALLLILPVASGALAQSDQGPDSYGLYFNQSGNFVNSISAVPNSLLDIHIVLAGSSRPTIGGWEVAFRFTQGTGTIIATGYNGTSSNEAEPPMFIVGMGVPALLADFHVLATMEFFYFSGQCDWYGGPSIPSTMPESPSYFNGQNMNDLVPCTFSTVVDGSGVDENGWTLFPLAVINGDAPVATEIESWGSVKGLFR
jgi:hypothetical protein